MKKQKRNSDYNILKDALLSDIEKVTLPEALEPEKIEKSVQGIEPKKRKLLPLRYIYAAAVLVLVVLTGAIELHFGFAAKEKAQNPEPMMQESATPQGEVLNTEHLKTADSYNEVYAYFLARKEAYEKDAIDGSVADMNGTKKPGAGAPMRNPAHSETNLQKAGVLESDMLLTDGRYLYTLYLGGEFASPEIRIVDAENPSDLRVVSVIRAKDLKLDIPYKVLSPQSLYLSGHYLVTLWRSHNFEGSSNARMVCDTGLKFTTHAVIFDIENPAKPKIVQLFSMDGDTISSRLVGNRFFLITQYAVGLDVPENELKDSCIPQFNYNGTAHKFPERNIQCVKDAEESSYLLVGSFNIEQPSAAPEVLAVLGGGNTVFCSQNALLVANGFRKEAAISEANAGAIEECTRLFAFSLEKQLCFQGETVLPGTLLSQFSMDEHDGSYRIATNTRREGTQITILNKDLSVLGKLSGIAKGEDMKAARFLGDTAYLVTFKQTDPLFVLDLKDPAQPKVVGELKIPGFSEYLHPLDGGYLIGVGQDGESVSHLKISLFDVRDPQAPKEVDTYIFKAPDAVFSVLLQTHKAWLQFSDPFAFAIPVEEASTEAGIGSIYLQTVRVQEGKLQIGTRYAPPLRRDPNETIYPRNPLDAVQRGAYIGNTVFTLSQNSLVSYDKESGEVLDALF